MLSLGWWIVHGLDIEAHRERVQALARLATDSRWRGQFKLINIGHVPGGPIEPIFKGVIPRDRIAAATTEALASPNSQTVHFGRSRQDAGDRARLYLEPGRAPVYGGVAPHMCLARWRVVDDDAAAMAAWCELMHELTSAMSAEHGIITAATNEDLLRIDLWLSNVSIEGRSVHPDPGEISSLAAQRSLLGERVRRPHWGTYLNPAHVAAVGGRDRILEVVRPPVVRDIGKLIYVQLTERVEDALAPETQARRRAFTDLLAPITVPRLPDRP